MAVQHMHNMKHWKWYTQTTRFALFVIPSSTQHPRPALVDNWIFSR